MTRDGTWVDYWFVQATAWYLELDVWIIATSSTESSPYIAISGNIEDGAIPCDGPIITIGTKSNCHYQSLLPIEMFHLEFTNPQQHPTKTETLVIYMHSKFRPVLTAETISGLFHTEK